MHGFQNILYNRIIICVIFLLITFITGCGTTKRTDKASRNEELKEFLAKYEKTFDPSSYNPDVESIKTEEKKIFIELESANNTEIALPETLPGFRIQVLFTTEIEEANKIRDSLNNTLPDEWVYIIFDTPYYKVRVGNFIDRYEAQKLLKKLTSSGYNEAWIVPDRIIKNPPPRPTITEPPDN